MYHEILPFIFFLLTTDLKVPLGWLPIPELPGASRANPKGWALIWIAFQKEMVVDGIKKLVGYEQPVIVEAPGALVVVRDGKGRVGFVEQHRAHRPRLDRAMSGQDGLGYIKLLMQEALWGALMESHPGSVLLELPAGLVDPADIAPGRDYEDLVRRIGEREAAQETGFTVRVTQVFTDSVNPNPVFFLHPQNVVVGKLEAIGHANPDPEEAIKGRRWLTPEEIRLAIREKRIMDSRAIHALYLAEVL